MTLAGLGARNAKLNGGIDTDENIVLGKSLAGGGISEFHLYHRVLTQSEAEILSVWPETTAALAYPTAKLTPTPPRSRPGPPVSDSWRRYR